MAAPRIMKPNLPHLPIRPRRHAFARPLAQKGFTLLELMVGVAIGLLVVAVATAALMVSRGVSGTVSDASGIQQQAAYAMRVIGLQLRQAGSLYLNLDPRSQKPAAALVTSTPVAFETTAKSDSGLEFDPSLNTVSGTATPTTLTVGYRRYKELVYTDAAEQSQARNCVGGPANSSADQRIDNVFQLSGSQLQCSGNGAAAQTLVQNVADFQVRYLIQDNTKPGSPGIQYVPSANVDAWTTVEWSKVRGVEVCLVLYGNEPIDLPAGSSYVGCNGTSVNMTTLTGQRNRRMHIAYRNVFQLRSQGLIGSVL
ncbi:type IV pilus assembly protein PilW [Delftia sp. 60]|nr:type IV pilus assembly protein PilW [Burkholderiales bacterium 23]PIF68494.1 type IV pilus assembly protein PilW [Delftia sp. 60]